MLKQTATRHPPIELAVAENTCLHAGLIALAAAFLATLLDPLLGHGISRLSVGDFNLGTALATVARLWLVASFFGFLAVESVGAIEWVMGSIARP